jgi:restriction endonuclease S subunit
MRSVQVTPAELSRTFSLNIRPDTHYFLKHELPEFKESLSNAPVPLRKYVSRLRSGEYIPKASYSDSETEYVYLTVGQFSGSSVSFDELTYLDPTAGENFERLQVKDESLVITRSGTVGVVHVFRAPDAKVYIPSHHLAIVEIAEHWSELIEYLRLFLQTDFARKYFWAFASGKSQKEISNWSIESIPIPRVDRPEDITAQGLEIEYEINRLRREIERLSVSKDEVLAGALGR